MKKKKPPVCEEYGCKHEATLDVRVVFTLPGTSVETRHKYCEFHSRQWKSMTCFEDSELECRFEVTKTPIEEDA